MDSEAANHNLRTPKLPGDLPMLKTPVGWGASSFSNVQVVGEKIIKEDSSEVCSCCMELSRVVFCECPRYYNASGIPFIQAPVISSNDRREDG